MPDTSLHRRIVTDLVAAGRGSPYAADANEPDPRYLGYGVRAGTMQSAVSLRRQNVSSVITLYALRDIKGAERAKVLARE